jgi:hypothetical protein
MTVKELIEELQSFDENMEVKFSYNSGDYWKTTLAEDVCQIDTHYVKYSEYHRTNKLISEYDDIDDDVQAVVLLS